MNSSTIYSVENKSKTRRNETITQLIIIILIISLILIVFSTFSLKISGINLNRKMLSEMAINDPQGFENLVNTAKKALNA